MNDKVGSRKSKIVPVSTYFPGASAQEDIDVNKAKPGECKAIYTNTEDALSIRYTKTRLDEHGVLHFEAVIFWADDVTTTGGPEIASPSVCFSKNEKIRGWWDPSSKTGEIETVDE